MKSFLKSWTLAAILMGALTSVLAPRAAAQTGSIGGTILDVNGNPWAEVVIRSVSDQGAKQETKTDSAGKYSLPNLRAGIYTVFVVFPPPNDKQAPYEVKCRVQAGEEAKVDLNFKDIVAKQGSAAQEQVKKAEEAKAKLEGLKAHFTAGNALIDQEKQVKADLQKAPADQRDALKQKLADVSDQAVKEFQEASKSLVEKDPNAHLVWFKLGEAYDTRAITTTWATCWRARERSTKPRLHIPRARNLTRRMPQPRGAILASAYTTQIGLATPLNHCKNPPTSNPRIRRPGIYWELRWFTR